MTSLRNISVCSNASSNSVNQDYWRLDEDYGTHGRIVAVFLLLFILLGLPWNILVLITIIREKLYRQPTTILLLVLVLADIFILIVPAPILMTTGFAGEFVGLSDKMRCLACRLEFAFTSLTPMYSSFFSIVLMAVDRFIYIYKPLQYDRLVTPLVMWIPVFVIGVVSIAIGLALFLTPRSSSSSFYPQILSCAVDIKPVLIALAVIAVAGLVMITVSNVGFSYIVLKNIKAVYYTGGKFLDEARKRSQTSTRHKKESRLYLMFFVLLLTSSISWVPIISLIVEFAITHDFHFKLSYISFALIIFYSQALMDPFVETMLLVEVRKPLINMLTCGLLKRTPDKPARKEEEINNNREHSKEHSNQLTILTLFEAIIINNNTTMNGTV